MSKLNDIEDKNKVVKTGKSTYYSSNKELKEYINYIKKYKIKGNRNIGCIIMNCNPFTYGHKYLIEQALKKVDYLYIFVVEENRSFFTFDDRINMVKEGIKEFSNITVLPSGQFIISSLTFPEYFDKEDNQDVRIDATNDLRIFGEKIAPALKIKTRFVGEEPIDKITRQYNDAMSTELNKYGIKFICIPRLKHNQDFISASIVREKMSNYDVAEIKELVPNTTYNIIKKYMN
jgi:[citrate (pro-3S)-lyase] ligase